MRYITDPGPWMDGVEHNLSVVDLLANGTIPALPAAALWWALEQGASLLTAGGPSGAGKSTLAHAALTFLPLAARVYVVSGRGDPLTLPPGEDRAYLLISELSAHGRPQYVSGPTAQRAFALLRDGLHLVGTLHADSVNEAVASLRGEFEIPAADIAQVTLVAISRITRGEHSRYGRRPRVQAGADVERRVVEIGLLTPAAEGEGVRVEALTTWEPEQRRLELRPGAGAALAGWAGAATETVERALRDRAAALTASLQEGRSPDAVAAAVARFRVQQPA